MPTFEQVLELEAAQEADSKAVETAISKAEAEITALDSHRLTAQESRERTQEIRDRAILVVRDARKNAVERAKHADAMRQAFEPDAYRRVALSQQAANIAPLFNVLHAVPTHGLLAYLHDAVLSENVAVAEAVRLVFQQRHDRADHLASFAATFVKLKTPEADEARTRLGRIRGAAHHIDVRISELIRGRRNGVARLDALRGGNAA